MIHEVDVIYVSRNQESRWPREGTPVGDRMRREIRNYLVLSRALIEKADPKSNLSILHPLPIDDRYPEILSDVEDLPSCHYYDQAANGPFTRMGILHSMFHEPGASTPREIREAEQPSYAEFAALRDHDGVRDDKDVHLRDIESGIVIDHLDPGRAFDVYRALNARFRQRGDEPTVWMGIRADTTRGSL